EPEMMGAMADMGEMEGAPVPVQTQAVAQEPVRVEKTPGRNEPCFCGSGKKYKLCHGRCMQDFSEDLAELSRRVSDARTYLNIDDLRARHAELETEVAGVDWNADAEHARAVSTDYQRVG